MYPWTSNWSTYSFLFSNKEHCGAMVKRRIKDRELAGSNPATSVVSLNKTLYPHCLTTGFYSGRPARNTQKMKVSQYNYIEERTFHCYWAIQAPTLGAFKSCVSVGPAKYWTRTWCFYPVFNLHIEPSFTDVGLHRITVRLCSRLGSALKRKKKKLFLIL